MLPYLGKGRDTHHELVNTGSTCCFGLYVPGWSILVCSILRACSIIIGIKHLHVL